MGLDMYLTKKIYIGANYEHNKITGVIDLKKDGEPIPVDLSKLVYIEERAGYWRKANAIHNWFVENVQDGTDDCRSYYVSHEKLEELRDLCKDILSKVELVDGKVIANPDVCADLPTTSGFFFGGTEYNEWYVQDLKDTVAICEEALQDPNGEFEYQSSW